MCPCSRVYYEDVDYLSICAIVKDENCYLPEWIEYHKLLGVEKFFIYDNESRVPIAETLAQDIASGYATVTPILGERDQQSQAYMDCLKRFGKDTSWIAFIDIDEFICPHHLDDLRIFLRDYEEFDGLAINWQVFGPSGHVVKPPGLQIEQFTMKGAVDLPWWNRHIKTVARPSRVAQISNPHYCTYRPNGTGCVDERRAPVIGPWSDPVSVGMAQINHYFTRSHAEFQEKVDRGGPNKDRKKFSLLAKIEKDFSKVQDTSILRFVERLREALSKRDAASHAHERVNVDRVKEGLADHI